MGVRHPGSQSPRFSSSQGWYDLFSRGARDWLRHNAKARESAKQALPDVIAGTDVMTGPEGRRVRVPVKLLEHARLRLRDADVQTGIGQGAGEVGQVLAGPAPGAAGGRGAGEGEGEVQIVMEVALDDLLDDVWEMLKLPRLQPKTAPQEERSDYTREGWAKRGVRSRLDRRRTVKAAVKRRAVQHDPVPFIDEDLRFRQLAQRPRPAARAAVIFALDVSGSMGDTERRLAKTFFFFALHGLKREYPRVEVAFVAHSAQAWEFGESQFFQAAGSGGTVSSTAFALAREIVDARFDPARYNVYFFYASDGENVASDRHRASAGLRALAPRLAYGGFIETRPAYGMLPPSEIARLFEDLKRQRLPFDLARVAKHDDVWPALRAFFRHELREREIAGA